MKLVKAQNKTMLPGRERDEAVEHRGWEVGEKEDAMSWRLPSGKALAQFALEAGFLVPGLLRGSVDAREHVGRVAANDRKRDLRNG
ncbi:MAG: hypothetical protein JO022_02265 [Acidobacteriaceae bacterium]|nr:hypothetical protein [Acidobacteriaceae bacterium]